VAQEKILVVDDEEAIREVVTTLLEAQGYRCAMVGKAGWHKSSCKRTRRTWC